MSTPAVTRLNFLFLVSTSTSINRFACVRLFVFFNLQSDVAELAALPQGVHLGHGGIQEGLVLEDQISIRDHFGAVLGGEPAGTEELVVMMSLKVHPCARVKGFRALT